MTKGSAPTTSLAIDPATNRIATSGFVYDAAGNLTQWPQGLNTMTAVYDAHNRITQMPSRTFTYGPDNRRMRVQGAETKIFMYGLAGELLSEYVECTANGDVKVLCQPDERVYLAGRLVWTRSDPHLVYRLGTASGTMYPYGDAGKQGADSFATYYHDQYTGLDYAWNRYYTSTWGRFLSADQRPTVLEKPQSWNRYTYSWNDPINLNDPDGNLPAATPGCDVSGFRPPGGPIHTSSNCPPGFIYIEGAGNGNWTSISLSGQLSGAVSLIESIGADVSLAARGYSITLDADLFNFMVDTGTIHIGPGATGTLGGILIRIDWGAAGATIGAALSNPVTIAVAAGVVAIGGVAWHLANNKAEYDQSKEAVRRYQRQCGKTFDADEKQRLHRSISKKSYSHDAIVAEAREIFGYPKPSGN